MILYEGKCTVKWCVNTSRSPDPPPAAISLSAPSASFTSSVPPRRHNRAALRLLRPYLPGGHIRQLPRHLRRLGHAIHAKRHQLLHRQPRLGRRLHRGLLHTLPGNLSTSSANKELECNIRAFLVSEYLGPTMYNDMCEIFEF